MITIRINKTEETGYNISLHKTNKSNSFAVFNVPNENDLIDLSCALSDYIRTYKYKDNTPIKYPAFPID